MDKAFKDKRIVLGVTGGVAVYKLVDLASKLTQAGALVDVIMTEAAQRFVTPLTFAAITHRKVRTDLWDDWLGDDTGHVALAREADALLVAPATANTIARLAIGLSDDLLAAVALSSTAPLLLAPAMESHMYGHPATQANLNALRERGATVIEPGSGYLASGASGVGRLPDTETLLGALRLLLGRNGDLAGKHIIVTAGGTREPLDPVRYITNHSSGRMGLALAQAALDRGARVTLIHAPLGIRLPYGVEAVPIGTTRELEAAVQRAAPGADILIMAAAPADYRATTVADQKIKKTPGQEDFSLELVKNPDILAGLRGLAGTERLIKVGFAAETEHLLENAQAKLAAKDLNMIVANDAVATFGAEVSIATIIRREGPPLTLPQQSKEDTAHAILDLALDRLARNDGI